MHNITTFRIHIFKFLPFLFFLFVNKSLCCEHFYLPLLQIPLNLSPKCREQEKATAHQHNSSFLRGNESRWSGPKISDRDSVRKLHRLMQLWGILAFSSYSWSIAPEIISDGIRRGNDCWSNASCWPIFPMELVREHWEVAFKEVVLERSFMTCFFFRKKSPCNCHFRVPLWAPRLIDRTAKIGFPCDTF